jgi:hypothetical protein
MWHCSLCETVLICMGLQSLVRLSCPLCKTACLLCEIVLFVCRLCETTKSLVRLSSMRGCPLCDCLICETVLYVTDCLVCETVLYIYSFILSCPGYKKKVYKQNPRCVIRSVCSSLLRNSILIVLLVRSGEAGYIGGGGGAGQQSMKKIKLIC